MLVFATSMRGGLAYPSDGWVLPQGRAAAMPPLTPPHSNWPLFFVPLPSLHADQDNDDIAPAMQRPTSSLFNSTLCEKWLFLAFHRSISDSVPQGKGEGTWKQEDVEQ